MFKVQKFNVKRISKYIEPGTLNFEPMRLLPCKFMRPRECLIDDRQQVSSNELIKPGGVSEENFFSLLC
jgi:hypothetical protein